MRYSDSGIFQAVGSPAFKKPIFQTLVPGRGYFTMGSDRDVRQFWVVFCLKFWDWDILLLENFCDWAMLSLGIFCDWGLLLYSK